MSLRGRGHPGSGISSPASYDSMQPNADTLILHERGLTKSSCQQHAWPICKASNSNQYSQTCLYRSMHTHKHYLPRRIDPACVRIRRIICSLRAGHTHNTTRNYRAIRAPGGVLFSVQPRPDVNVQTVLHRTVLLCVLSALFQSGVAIMYLEGEHAQGRQQCAYLMVRMLREFYSVKR